MVEVYINSKVLSASTSLPSLLLGGPLNRIVVVGVRVHMEQWRVDGNFVEKVQW